MRTVLGLLDASFFFVGAVRQGEEPMKGRPSLSAATTSLAAAKYRYDGLGVVVSSFFFFSARWIFFFTVMKPVLLAFTRRWHFPSFSCTTSVSFASRFITQGFHNFSSNKSVVVNCD